MTRKIFAASIIIILLASMASANDTAGHENITPISAMIRPLVLNDDVLAKLAQLAGVDPSQIHFLTGSNISGARNPTDTMKTHMRREGYESLCSLGTVTVDVSGLYAFGVDFPKELVGLDISRLKLYALKYTGVGGSVMAASESDARMTDNDGNEAGEIAESMIVLMMLESGDPVCMILAGAIILADGGSADSCGGGGEGGILAAAVWLILGLATNME